MLSIRSQRPDGSEFEGVLLDAGKDASELELLRTIAEKLGDDIDHAALADTVKVLGVPPVLLVDDLASELDAEARDRFFEAAALTGMLRA